MRVKVFLPEGGPIAAGDLEGARPVGRARIPGTVFEVEGVGRAIILSGGGLVGGEIHSIEPGALADADARARVREGLFRRVGVQVDEHACWTWVVGPTLAPSLAPGRKSRRTRDPNA